MLDPGAHRVSIDRRFSVCAAHNLIVEDEIIEANPLQTRHINPIAPTNVYVRLPHLKSYTNSMFISYN